MRTCPICGSRLNEPKTYLEDFCEKFPNAKDLDNLCITVCRKVVYGDVDCRDGINCNDCWNEVMKGEL